MSTIAQPPRLPFTKNQRRILLALGSVVGLRMLGLFLVMPVFTLYGLQFTSSRVLAGLAFGSYGITMAIFQIPMGRWSDRVGRRKALIFGMTVFSLGSFLCATPAWFPQRLGIWVLIVGRLVQGCGAIVSVAFAAVADHIEPERRSTAMAAIGIPIGASFVLGIVGGPLLAGIFARLLHVEADAGGIAALFWLTGALALLTDGLLLRYLPDTQPETRRRAPLAEVLRSGSLLAVDTSGLILNFFMSSFFFYFPLIAKLQLGMSPTQYYEVLLPMLAANGIAMFAISHSADKGNTRPLAAACFLIMAASAVLLFRPEMVGLDPRHLLALVVPGALFFVSFGGLEPMLPSEVSRSVSAGDYGTALGVYNTMQFVGSSLGPPLAGALSKSASTPIMTVLAGASLLGFALMAGGRR
jgi:MFS family permease